jgi:hypothetical protein
MTAPFVTASVAGFALRDQHSDSGQPYVHGNPPLRPASELEANGASIPSFLPIGVVFLHGELSCRVASPHVELIGQRLRRAHEDRPWSWSGVHLTHVLPVDRFELNLYPG